MAKRVVLLVTIGIGSVLVLMSVGNILLTSSPTDIQAIENPTGKEGGERCLDPWIDAQEFAERTAENRWVAHGGGSFENTTVSNRIGAFDFNYIKGFRTFEIDFELNAHDQLVLIHVDNRQASDRFKANRNQGDSSTLPSLAQLATWLEDHADVIVITDTKGDNIKVLQRIAESFPELRSRFIPQIYSFDEYQIARELGFEDIIYTTYLYKLGTEEILNFAIENDLYAVTMPVNRAIKGELPYLLGQLGVPTYAHTVNDKRLMSQLISSGIDGVYTDEIAPESCAAS